VIDPGWHAVAAFLLVAQPSDTDLLIRRWLPSYGLLCVQKALTAPGKGLLAIDESNATAGKLVHLLGSHRHHEVHLSDACSFACNCAPYTSSHIRPIASKTLPWCSKLGSSFCKPIAALQVVVHVADLLPRLAGKRLDSIGVENTQENRRAYRTLLLNAPGVSQN
jgi:Fructose-bisphosphate aldolase class-I